MMTSRSADRVLVVGGGIAGLATALHLAPLPVPCLLHRLSDGSLDAAGAGRHRGGPRRG